MKIKSSFIKRHIAVLSALLLLHPAAAAEKAAPQKGAGDFTVVSGRGIENESFSVLADAAGNFTLTDKRTGDVWYSNPTERENAQGMSGINKMQMNSQLIVNYLIDGKNQKSATSFASSTKKEGVSVSADSAGLRVTYSFISEEFTVPVLYTLDSFGLTASVLTSEIKESEKNKITEISLLPYFGAASVNDSGYFLVPDGSGALISFNNGKTKSSYQQKIYDTDGLMNKDTSIINVQTAKLPVFGVEKNGKTLFANISSGAAAAKLYAFVSGTNGVYNYIYPQFTYRQSAVDKMLSKTWYPIDVTFTSKKTAEESFSVRYSPVSGNSGGYSGMAALYREMLTKEKGVKPKAQAEDAPLYLDLYGNAKVKDNILGFPVTKNQALTSFKEAREILRELTENKVDSVKVRYLGIDSGGITHIKTPTAFKPTAGMGGKKGFADLKAFAEKNNIEIYPDNDFLFFKKAPFSLFARLDAAKDVCDKSAKLYSYTLSNGKMTGTDRYILKPEKARLAAQKYMKSYGKADNKYISLSNIGSFVYSDFSGDICLAGKTAEIFGGVMKEYAENGYSLLLKAPNDYALPYTAAITAAPVTSSLFDIEDEAVPFYQMVMHGLISYSVPAVNLSDSDAAVLKAIETGSSLMYALSAADYSVLANDNYDELYGITASHWISEICENYAKVKNALAAVSNKTMLLHEKLQSGVYRTVYEGGTQIIVNYNSAPVEINGERVEGLSYKAFKGEER